MTIFLFVGASFSRKLGQVCLGQRERLRLSLSLSVYAKGGGPPDTDRKISR